MQERFKSRLQAGCDQLQFLFCVQTGEGGARPLDFFAYSGNRRGDELAIRRGVGALLRDGRRPIDFRNCRSLDDQPSRRNESG